jgi:hypothetical protein
MTYNKSSYCVALGSFPDDFTLRYCFQPITSNLGLQPFGALFPGIKRASNESDHSQIKNAWTLSIERTTV